jgi:hypothetical protein
MHGRLVGEGGAYHLDTDVFDEVNVVLREWANTLVSAVKKAVARSFHSCITKGGDFTDSFGNISENEDCL